MFLEKYKQYKNYYLINEATDEELELINFISTVKPIRDFIDQHVDDFTIKNYTGITIFQYISDEQRANYAKRKMKIIQSILKDCSVYCDVSQHAMFNFLVRESIENVQKLFNINNKELFKKFCDDENILPTDSINSGNIQKRSICPNYILDQQIIDNILIQMKEAINKYKLLIPKAILKILTSKKYGIVFYVIKNDLKVILEKAQLTIGIYIDNVSSNVFELKVSNVYKTNSDDYNTKRHTLIKIKDM